MHYILQLVIVLRIVFRGIEFTCYLFYTVIYLYFIFGAQVYSGAILFFTSYLVTAIKCHMRDEVPIDKMENGRQVTEGIVDCDESHKQFMEGKLKTLNKTDYDTVKPAYDKEIKECKDKGLEGCLTIRTRVNTKRLRCTCGMLYLLYVKPKGMKQGQSTELTKAEQDKFHKDFETHPHWEKIAGLSKAEHKKFMDMNKQSQESARNTKTDLKDTIQVTACPKEKCNEIPPIPPMKCGSAQVNGNAIVGVIATVTVILSLF